MRARLLMSTGTLGWLLLVACDDTTFESGGGGAVDGEGWCGVKSLFDAECVSCHSTALKQGELDLQADPHAALIDVPSTNPGRTLVVPGDPAGSFLLTKLKGEQTATEGVTMPVTGALEPDVIAIVEAWIAAGADEVCDDTGGTGVPTCDDANEACAPPGCDPDPESPLMKPGADCLGCHGLGHRFEDAPLFTAAGTVFSDVYGSGPLAGAVVHIYDAQGAEVLDPAGTLVTNAAGNFYTNRAFNTPFTAAVEYEGTTLAMSATQTEGGCSSCHQCGGEAGGKLYGP